MYFLKPLEFHAPEISFTLCKFKKTDKKDHQDVVSELV
jgi:hypothetical protein